VPGLPSVLLWTVRLSRIRDGACCCDWTSEMVLSDDWESAIS